MTKTIVAALAAVGLAGCVAVPAPYAGEAYYGEAYYYPAPAPVIVAPAPVIGFGVYAGPGYRHHRRHHRRWH